MFWSMTDSIYDSGLVHYIGVEKVLSPSDIIISECNSLLTCLCWCLCKQIHCCQSYKSITYTIIYSTYFLIMIINQLWFMYLLFYTFHCYFRRYSSYLQKKKCLLLNSIPCYTSSNLIHVKFTASPDCFIFSCAWFNLLLFYTVRDL